ncbi:MAG: AAA family ATPase [Bacilli bacterium]
MKVINSKNNIQIKNNIIDGIMKSNGLYCLVARPKVGKSLLALQIAHSLVSDKQFLGFDTNTSPVLYISTELSESQLNERIEIAKYDFGNSLFFVEKDNNNSLSLRDDLLIDIKEFAEDIHGKFVIVDMMCGIDYGAYYDINDYKSMTEVVFSRYRKLIKRYNLTFLLIHHTNKSGNSLGSTAIEGCVDGTFHLKDNGFQNYTFSTSSRDFDSINLNLKLNKNLSFEIAKDDNSELDFNISSFLRYVIKNKQIKFTSAEMVAILALQVTPTKFGMLLKRNLEKLKNEGLNVIEKRTGNARYYEATFIDPMSVIDDNT